jgi:N,N-dimethylformamidase beta subunit-like, C-terminal
LPLGLVLAAFFLGLVLAPAALAANPITIENANPGTTTWQLGQAGFQTADDATGQIKGYASNTSVNKGENLTFYITVNPVQTYTIDIYRMGWYGGDGGRLLQHVNPIAGVQQPTCPLDVSTGLRECTNWSPSYTFTVPTTWTSGVYLALLTNSQNYQNYIPFTVRDDTRKADLLFQSSVTTWQAYNNYPNDGATGKSIYPSNSFGPNTVTGSPRAVKVSFDRPYLNDGAGELFEAVGYPSDGTELYFIRWLERSGYDVSYSTNVDTHANGNRLVNYKGFMSIGHDEYWTKPMFDAAEAARDAGTNLAFFGGNDVYWQMRFEPSGTGTPDRVLVTYKNAAGTLDPVQGPTTTTKWRNPPVNRPEQTLLGVQSVDGAAFFPQEAPYIVTNSSHWLYNGTGLQDNDSVPGLVGYEFDRFNPQFQGPSSVSDEALSNSPVMLGSEQDFAEANLYQAPSGAFVFAAGTIWWSYGLDKPGVEDPRIQQMTTNLLNRFADSYEHPGSPVPLSFSLVPVFRQCTNNRPPNGQHSPPFNVRSCSPSVPVSGVAGGASESTGSATMTPIAGDPGTPVDEADVGYNVNLTDVKTRSGGVGGSLSNVDYDPNPSGADMTVDARMRVTDFGNCTPIPCSAPHDRAGTTVDTAMGIPVICAPVSGPIGSTCAVTTTAEAFVPGAYTEGRRTVSTIFRVMIRDSGPNQVRGDGDDTLYAQQGFYVP